MSLRFDPQTGLVVVPTHLWGPAGHTIVRLALDTGASGSVVGWSTLRLVGYDPAVVSERIQLITGSGVEFAPRLVVERLTALGPEKV